MSTELRERNLPTGYVVDSYAEFVRDVVTTAVEGGSNYWLGSIKVIQGYDEATDPRTLHLEVEVEGETKQVTFAHVRWALLQAIVIGTCREDIRLHIKHGIRDHYAGDIDALGADVVFQIATLGELTYG